MELIRGWGAVDARAVAGRSVVSIGSFDGPHAGHAALVRRLGELAGEGESTVLTTFEPHPRAVLAPDAAPVRISRWADRLVAFERLGVDALCVLRFDARLMRMSPLDFAERLLVKGLRATQVVVGADFRFGHRAAGNVAMLAEIGARAGFGVEVHDDVQVDGARVSSSRVRERLAAGDLGAAAELLGGPYRVSGRIAYGEQIGRKLGYRTANLAIAGWTPPVAGVFAVRARVANERGRPACAASSAARSPPAPLPGEWGGMANVGMRPTVGGLKRTLEVHLFDFDADLYGRRLEVDFIAHLRGEQRFDGLDALRAQLACDAEAARRALA